MSQVRRTGITVPELLGVFTLLGVLCAAVTPHLVEFRQAARLSELRFNLERLRTRIDEFRQRHGQPPQQLEELIGHDAEPIYENPISLAPEKYRERVKVIAVDPPAREHATPLGYGGWLYNPETGGIWVDNEAFLFE